jgi:acyl-CoA dehydrogenase
MDIVGGAGICKGSHNVLANVYQAIPIGITVEGSNTLTRSLIIFGNGLMKSHPYLYDLIQSLEKKEEDQFFDLMKKFVWLHLYNGVRTMTYQMSSPFYSSSLKHGGEKYNAQFAVYAGLILLLGKKFKTSECLSGRMADIMGSLYICTALEWYGHHGHHHHPCNQSLKELIVIAQKEELIKIRLNFQEIANNFPLPPIRLLMQFLNQDLFSWNLSDNDRIVMALAISKNADIRTLFMENIHLSPLLEEMCKEHEHVLKYHSSINSNIKKEKSVDELIHKAISVDEYPSNY